MFSVKAAQVALLQVWNPEIFAEPGHGGHY